MHQRTHILVHKLNLHIYKETARDREVREVMRIHMWGNKNLYEETAPD